MSKQNGILNKGAEVAELKEEKIFPVEPIHSNIVILPFKAEDVSVGGIVIPDSVKQRPSKGTVMSVGPGTTLKVGDIILHVKDAGTEIEVNGIKHYLMPDREVLAKLH